MVGWWKAPLSMCGVVKGCSWKGRSCVPDILEPEAGRSVLAEHPDCRWILVSLGGNRENADTARLLAAELTARGAAAPTVIHYHASEDAGRNRRKSVPGNVISRKVEVVPFGTGFSSYRKELRTLEKRTVRQSLPEAMGQI